MMYDIKYISSCFSICAMRRHLPVESRWTQMEKKYREKQPLKQRCTPKSLYIHIYSLDVYFYYINLSLYDNFFFFFFAKKNRQASRLN